MNPISQIELKAHFRDLQQQAETARQSQSTIVLWIQRLWQSRHSDASGGTERTPAWQRAPGH
jgi:hypothetical protein